MSISVSLSLSPSLSLLLSLKLKTEKLLLELWRNYSTSESERSNFSVVCGHSQSVLVQILDMK